MWAFHDTKGKLQAIKVPAYHVPQSRVCLLSSTNLWQTYPPETIKQEPHQLTLSGLDGDPTRGTVIARVDKTNNLPMTLAYQYEDTSMAVEAPISMINVVKNENINLSEPQKELLHWYQHLGHAAFCQIQFLF
jgi:hypothetical protein